MAQKLEPMTTEQGGMIAEALQKGFQPGTPEFYRFIGLSAEQNGLRATRNLSPAEKFFKSVTGLTEEEKALQERQLLAVETAKALQPELAKYALQQQMEAKHAIDPRMFTKQAIVQPSNLQDIFQATRAQEPQAPTQPVMPGVQGLTQSIGPQQSPPIPAYQPPVTQTVLKPQAEALAEMGPQSGSRASNIIGWMKALYPPGKPMAAAEAKLNDERLSTARTQAALADLQGRAESVNLPLTTYLEKNPTVLSRTAILNQITPKDLRDAITGQTHEIGGGVRSTDRATAEALDRWKEAGATDAALKTLSPMDRFLITTFQQGKVKPEPTGNLMVNAVDHAASRYLVDGTLPQNLGRGIQGAANTAKILNRAADMASDQGLTGEETRIRQLAGHSAGQALTTISTQETKMRAFEGTFRKNVDLVEKLSEKVDRTGTPIINGWIQAGQRSVAGNVDITNFDAAIKGAVNEYAKIVSSATGSGTTAEAEIKKVEALLATKQTKAQVLGVIRVLRQETQNRIDAFDEEKQRIQDSLKHIAPKRRQADTIIDFKDLPK